MTIIVTPTHCQIFFIQSIRPSVMVITKENGTLSMAVLLSLYFNYSYWTLIIQFYIYHFFLHSSMVLSIAI